jgi:hypothetical protein
LRILYNKMFHVVHGPKPTDFQFILTFVLAAFNAMKP